MSRIQFMNTYIDNLSMQEVVDKVDNMVANDEKGFIVTPNVDHIVKMEKDLYMRDIFSKSAISTVDGKPLMWIAKWYGTPFKEKVSGSDLGIRLCRLCHEKGYRLFIFGGKEGVAEKAKENLERDYPGINVCGVYSPPFGFEKNPDEVKKSVEYINQCKPDILFACVGAPKQEKFVYENQDELDYKVAACIGATVDFIAGNVKRAPEWISRIGFEWFYRFCKEPKRLFKRYFVDDMKIFKAAIKYKKKK